MTEIVTTQLPLPMSTHQAQHSARSACVQHCRASLFQAQSLPPLLTVNASVEAAGCVEGACLLGNGSGTAHRPFKRLVTGYVAGLHRQPGVVRREAQVASAGVGNQERPSSSLDRQAGVVGDHHCAAVHDDALYGPKEVGRVDLRLRVGW